MRLMLNITCCHCDRTTGIERFAVHIARELYRIDPSVLIVSSKVMPGVSSAVISRFLGYTSSYLKTYEYVARAVWDQTWFRRIIRLNKPDVLFFPIQDGLLSPPVKQIVTVHDLHYLRFRAMLSECRHEIGWFRTRLYHSKMPRILHSSAAVITVSESTKRDLVSEFGAHPDSIHVIHNGYDDTRFRAIDGPLANLDRYNLTPGNYFLFVGSILRHKNIIRIVEAFGCLKEDLTLVIAGVCKDDGYLGEVRDTAARLNIGDDRIRYIDYVPDDDLPSLYGGAAAFILPSLHEGFGVPIIEAMACGTPVITSNCSAMPEVAGGAALLVDPYSVEDIAAAMREICCNPQRTQALRHAGLERCKSFTWSHSARKLYDVCTMVSES